MVARATARRADMTHPSLTATAAAAGQFDDTDDALFMDACATIRMGDGDLGFSDLVRRISVCDTFARSAKRLGYAGAPEFTAALHAAGMGAARVYWPHARAGILRAAYMHAKRGGRPADAQLAYAKMVSLYLYPESLGFVHPAGGRGGGEPAEVYEASDLECSEVMDWVS